MLPLMIKLISIFATLYTVLIFARVILSWVSPGKTNPLVQLVYRLTEPVLGPVRSLLPAVAGIDFSPVLVLIAIQLLERLAIQLLVSLGGPGF